VHPAQAFLDARPGRRAVASIPIGAVVTPVQGAARVLTQPDPIAGSGDDPAPDCCARSHFVCRVRRPLVGLATRVGARVRRVKVADRFTAPGDDVERYMYGFSILHCLPVGMVEQPSAATGTVMRAATLRRYAEEAGFRAVDVLPIEHDFFRFYRLTG
jgi:hypothetical protein